MNGSLLRTDGRSEPLPGCPLGEATGFSNTEPQITVPGTAANPQVVNSNSSTQGRIVGLAAPCNGSVCARSATVRFPRSFSAGATSVVVRTNAPEVDHAFEFTFTRECG